MTKPETVAAAAHAVLTTADPFEKARMSHDLFCLSLLQRLPAGGRCTLPDRPARPARPELKAPKDMPKRRGGGTLHNRIALLHALAHIELNAIDLAWDAAGRFGADMPDAFSFDWISVANDEAKHFLMLAERLSELGSSYGALPAHDGLWQAAYDTHDNLAARLSVVPMVLEARALDVSPPTITRLRNQADHDSADILQIIYDEEIEHVGIGAKWFFYLAKKQGSEPESLFDDSLERYFSSRPKPPFNYQARRKAGLYDSLYDPEKRKKLTN
ncbi:MAG: ferritin-like domain-containing protein [Pseudomonadota bacterium]